MLYHMDLGFPPNIRLELPNVIPLTWSKHAIKAAQEDRYAKINIFTGMSTIDSKIVEIETSSTGQILKIVLRKHYDKDLDISVVIAAGGVVKTVWLNKKTDQHKTLDKSKYEVPVA